MAYIPGFTPELMRADFTGGPARVDLQRVTGGSVPSIRPSAPAIMAASNTVRPSAPPTASGFGSGVLNAALARAAEQQAPQGAQPAGLTFYTDRGRLAGYGKGASGFVAFDPNAQYRMWDERGKNRIVSSGAGEAGLRSIHALANQFNEEQGKKANWGIERFDPATGRWVRILENDPAKNIVGKIADIALPVAGAFLLPGVGGVLGGALGAGLGAAGGSALSSVAQGRSLGDTLLRAGLSGVAAGGLSAVGGAPFLGASGAGGGVGGSLAAGTAGAGIMANTGAQLAGVLPGNIIVSGVGGGLGAALGGAAGAGIGAGVGGALGGGSSATVEGNPITVEGTRPTAPPIAAPVPLPGGQPTVEGNPITVTAPRQPTSFDENPTAPIITQVPVTPVQQPTVEAPTEKSDLDKIIDYIRAGSLGVGLLGNLFGGRQPVQNGVIPGGLGGGLSPVFSGALPAPTMPGASDNFAQRQGNQDWYRYGYGPGQSFFNYVPQGQPNTSTAYTGYAEGGLTMGDDTPRESFAVSGPGTGREDKIPALLSDGEYVIDAETVALLGDGSTKAGAEALDQFRVNVRKHKGSRLAKGQFSPDAKPLERYLGGLS